VSRQPRTAPSADQPQLPPASTGWPAGARRRSARRTRISPQRLPGDLRPARGVRFVVLLTLWPRMAQL